MRFGCISYLPDDPKVRDVRWKTTKKCIKNLCEISGYVKQPLHLVTTNWKSKEFEEVSDMNIVFYTVSMDRRGAAVSRNILLKSFYDSDEDYIMICDDDANIYPYYDFKDFITDLHNDPKKYLDERIFHICAHLANSAPFKEKNMKDSDFLQNWVFSSGGDHAGRCPQIFANFKKHLDSEIYQREYLYNEMKLGGEDGCFDLDLMGIGVMAYTLTSFIAGTTELVASFWNESKSKKEMLKDAVWEEGQATLDYIKKEFPKVRQITKYRLDFSAYRPKHKPRILVRRNKAYVPTDWDIPKKRIKKTPQGLLKKR